MHDDDDPENDFEEALEYCLKHIDPNQMVLMKTNGAKNTCPRCFQKSEKGNLKIFNYLGSTALKLKCGHNLCLVCAAFCVKNKQLTCPGKLCQTAGPVIKLSSITYSASVKGSPNLDCLLQENILEVIFYD